MRLIELRHERRHHLGVAGVRLVPWVEGLVAEMATLTIEKHLHHAFAATPGKGHHIGIVQPHRAQTLLLLHLSEGANAVT